MKFTHQTLLSTHNEYYRPAWLIVLLIFVFSLGDTIICFSLSWGKGMAVTLKIWKKWNINKYDTIKNQASWVTAQNKDTKTSIPVNQ